ncbi:MAG TPA: hypothetical protein ENK57_25895 [Polyangiaceae bacterium]|nr:hypothetical protein [Polyangiaceae bacterium]
MVLAGTTLQCAEPNEPVYASLLESDSWQRPSADAVTPDGTPDGATDGIDVAGAPMSLSEGASAVAPAPIDTPSDARIEAVKRCQDEVANAEITAPSDEGPLHEPAQVMPAILPTPTALPSAAAIVDPADLTADGGPRPGAGRDVDRPPRA